MKVLYCGPFYDGTGYSQAAIDYVLAMDSVGLDVVVRPIKLAKNHHKVPNRILELEAKSQIGCEVCIQHCLPSMFEYNSSYKNIGLFAWECDRLPPHSDWLEKCSMMDELWVINNYMKSMLGFDGISTPMTVIPHAIDLDKYKKVYTPPQQIRDIFDGDYIFYTVAENNRRKNLSSLIRAFHTEFDPSESVKLVIKTTSSLEKMNEDIISALKLYPKESYKKPVVLIGHIGESDLLSIHQNSDCFVTSSYGEAFCLPAYDAIGFGKQLIVPNHTCFKELPIPRVESHPSPCFAANDSLPELYSASEYWYGVDIGSLMYVMRCAYERKETLRCNNYIEGFSYHTIGNLIKSAIYAQSFPGSDHSN